MAPKFQLHYFDLNGKALPLRLALHISDIEFEDVRHPLDSTDYKTLAPLGQMPFLKMDGDAYLCQSTAILLYLASITDLGFKDGLSQSRIIEVAGIADDILLKVFDTLTIQNEADKLKKRQEICEDVLPGMFERFEKLLVKNGKGSFSVGDKLSLADLIVFALVDFLKCGFVDGLDLKMTDAYKTITGIYTKVGALPKVQEWMTKNEIKK